jgi:hypothetical protein
VEKRVPLPHIGVLRVAAHQYRARKQAAISCVGVNSFTASEPLGYMRPLDFQRKETSAELRKVTEPEPNFYNTVTITLADAVSFFAESIVIR